MTTGNESDDELVLLRAIVETQRAINAHIQDPQQVMDVIAERSQRLIGATGAVVELLEGDEMVYRAVSGSARSSLGLRLAAATSLSGRCVAEQPLFCDDSESDDRVDRDACRRVGVRSMIVVPLLLEDRPCAGVLKVLAPQPGAFQHQNVTTLAAMADFTVGLVGLVGLLALVLGGGPVQGGPTVVAAAIASGLSAGTSWRPMDARSRASWGVIALGTALWCAGHTSRPVWEAFRSGAPATRPFGDLASLAATLCLAAGIAFRLELPRRTVAKVRYLAEGMTLTASILFVSWVVVMPPAFAVARGSDVGNRVRLLGHPLADVLLLSIVVFAVIRLPRLGRWSVVLLGGAGALSLLSSAASNLGAQDVALRHSVELATSAGFAAIALAAVRSWPPINGAEPMPTPERARVLLLSAPGLSVLIVVGTTIRQVTGQPVAAELTWITIGVLTLSVLLHLTVISENRPPTTLASSRCSSSPSATPTYCAGSSTRSSPTPLPCHRDRTSNGKSLSHERAPSPRRRGQQDQPDRRRRHPQESECRPRAKQGSTPVGSRR